MTVADYIVKYLKENGVKDVFGIPGGVVLPLLYAFDNQTGTITPHLNYHEQMAGFAACGYAQAGNRLGVAYATRGPGITNMITCMAEAWQESIPVLFITAHGERGAESSMRYEFDQELDLVRSVSSFTKYSANVDRVESVSEQMCRACGQAMNGRKGPVFLDFSVRVLKSEYPDIDQKKEVPFVTEPDKMNYKMHETIKSELARYHRPVILVGDGVRQAGCGEAIKQWLHRIKVPVLSSRAAQDIVCDLEDYYGYIGSHGLRYSNFILSKADLIVAVGNRLSFPKTSETFSAIAKNAKILRIEIDESEFRREIPEAVNLCIDIREFIVEELQYDYCFEDKTGWLEICHKLRKVLKQYDMSEPVVHITEYIRLQSSGITYVCDVGNNEFWFSRAFEAVRPKAQVLYSKSFGTLGSALGKAIGVYYATEEKVVCVMGDQGFQYNIQELQYIAHWKLPITVLLLNNKSSGMICDQEDKVYGKQIHVTSESGYTVPDFKKICEGYGVRYIDIRMANEKENSVLLRGNDPMVYEISFSEVPLTPSIPKGNPCQQMTPLLEKDLYEKLNAL